MGSFREVIRPEDKGPQGCCRGHIWGRIRSVWGSASSLSQAFSGLWDKWDFSEWNIVGWESFYKRTKWWHESKSQSELVSSVSTDARLSTLQGTGHPGQTHHPRSPGKFYSPWHETVEACWPIILFKDVEDGTEIFGLTLLWNWLSLSFECLERLK